MKLKILDKRKKLQKFIYSLIFFNCLLIFCLTLTSLITNSWVTVRPIRRIPFDNNSQQENENYDLTNNNQNELKSFFKYQSTSSSTSSSASSSFDLIQLKKLNNNNNNSDKKRKSNNVDDDDLLIKKNLIETIRLSKSINLIEISNGDYETTLNNSDAANAFLSILQNGNFSKSHFLIDDVKNRTISEDEEKGESQNFLSSSTSNKRSASAAAAKNYASNDKLLFSKETDLDDLKSDQTREKENLRANNDDLDGEEEEENEGEHYSSSSSQALDLYEHHENCKRYTGKIGFGLFKGVWLLNYAYGCKNRANKISMIEMLMRHNIFDKTLWMSTILSCSLAIFSTFGCLLLSLLNMFMSSNKILNGPNSLYLWNFISCISHFMTIFLFMILYCTNIKKNVLTKEQLESGWTSNNLSSLDWSFYLLYLSFLLSLFNFLFLFVIVRLKHSLLMLRNVKLIGRRQRSHQQQNNNSNRNDINFNLMTDGEIIFSHNSSLTNLNELLPPFGATTAVASSSMSIIEMSKKAVDESSIIVNGHCCLERMRIMNTPTLSTNNEIITSLNNREMSESSVNKTASNLRRSSSRFRKLIDFIY